MPSSSPSRLGARATGWSVARQVLVLQAVVVLVLVLASLALAAVDARRDARATATERALAVARTLADSPALLDALGDPQPSVAIQPMAEQVRRDAAVDFVTVMSPDRIRFSHPDPANIGRRFIGDVGGAPEGRVFTQEYAGTLGPSMRAVVPVEDAAGRVVALVAVGITIDRIDRQLLDDLLPIGLAAVAVLAAGVLGAALVARRLRRQTHGLGERELTRMYEYYSAVLHAVREGLLLVDADGRVQLVNDEARRLLSLPDDADVLGRELGALGLAPGLVAAARGGAPADDELYLAGERMLLVSSAPADWDGRTVGAVVTLRDHTELRGVTGELAAVRRLTESLRAQNHESANRLHTVVSLIEMGRPEEAVDFAVEELQVAQLLTDRLVAAVDDPVVAALLLGKTADAAERGVELAIEGALPASTLLPHRDLVTVLGNLVDNAFDAVADLPVGQRRVRVDLAPHRLAVGDSGPGLPDADVDRVVEAGWTTKVAADDATGRGVGLALVTQVARRHGARLEIGHSPLGGAELALAWPEERS